MHSRPRKAADPLLPPHLAAACIFARASHKSAPISPPPSGVLGELALLLRSR
jgi:hypothetical protein